MSLDEEEATDMFALSVSTIDEPFLMSGAVHLGPDDEGTPHA